MSGVEAKPGARSTGAQKAPPGVVRVGIIGAGENVRDVMIPAFRRIPECQLVAVANTSLASSQRVARQFDIPKSYPHWKALLDDQDIDAVCIGTWPYMHHTLTLASLEKGKHVLCQARMANNAQEAREMLAASLRHPDLVCQLVPTSGSYRVDNLLGKLFADGFVGEVLSVEIQRVGRGFADFAGELDWRHSQEFSGLNIMNAGATYESTMRWLGRGNRVMAMAKVHVPYRRAANGQRASVTLPDHVDVLYELSNRAQVHMRFSETTGLSSGNQTWIHGSRGHHPHRRSADCPRREARRHATARDPQSSGGPSSRARRGGIHPGDPWPRAGHDEHVRDRRALHGVDRSGPPQCDDWSGGASAAAGGLKYPLRSPAGVQPEPGRG